MSSLGVCPKCRRWKDCPLTEKEKEWFDYGDIKWCPHQVFWILKWADILHAGNWPVKDDNAPDRVRGKTPTEASFARVSRIIAEVDDRLKGTGWRGRLLAEQCINRDRLEYLDYDAREALYYVAGWNRRTMTFSNWRKQWEHRRNDNQKVVTGVI